MFKSGMKRYRLLFYNKKNVMANITYLKKKLINIF